MKSIFLKLIFILQLVVQFCGCDKASKYPNYVCLYNIDCNIALDTNVILNSIYLSHDENCYLHKSLQELKFISPQKFRFVAKWKPESIYTYGWQVYLCAAHLKDSTHLLDYVRIIKLFSFEFYYSIDDNNYLNFVLWKSDINEVDLIISKKERYLPDQHHPHYNFLKLNDKLVSYAPLNTIKKETEFSEIYVYIYLKNLTDFLTYVTKVYILDHDQIEGFDHKVIGNHILVEIKGISLQLEKSPPIRDIKYTKFEGLMDYEKYSEEEIDRKLEELENPSKIKKEKEYIKFYLSAQSTEDTNGVPSKCGSPDTLWHVLNLPYQTTPEPEKSVTILLPLELYGKEIKICAATVDGTLQDYKTPIYSFKADDVSTGYYKDVFYASPLGITDITLSADFHPLSEIKLVNPCELDPNSAIYKSFTNLKTCKKSSEYILGYQHVDQEYMANASYRRDDIYLSIYNQNTLPNYMIPHKLYYLPDRSVRSKSGTLWTKKSIFLPKLHSEPTYPYVIMACDRWKHPLCFTDEEFDTSLGLIYPSRNFITKISAKWSQDKMIVELVTLAENKPVVKLVMSRDLQYTNYDSKCNNISGFYPADPVESSQDDGNKIISYEFSKLTPGKIYYLCVLREETPKNQPLKLVELYTKQEDKLKNPLKEYIRSDLQWEFFGIINTNTAMAGNRITFSKVGEKVSFLFPTTGMKKTCNLNGIYLSKDLMFDCSSLHIFASIVLPVPEYNYSSLITFVENNHQHVQKSWTCPGHDDTSQGFWLSCWATNWRVMGRYITYTGPFNPNGKFYKMCTCLHGECYSTGNAAYSKMESFELSQFIKMNDIYDKLILGRYICLYNRRNIKCFDGTDNFEGCIKKEMEFFLPQIEIKHVSFDHSTNLLTILSPNKIYIYETGLKTKIEIEEIQNMRSVFSFPKVTFMLSTESIHAYIGESTLNHVIQNKRDEEKFIKADELFDPLNEVKIDHNNLIFLNFSLKSSMENIQIYPIDEKSFYLFIIDNKLELTYYTIEIDYETQSHEITEKFKLSLKEHFPGARKRITLKAKKTSLFGKDMMLFFFSHYEHETIKVFYLDPENEEIKFYSDVNVSVGIIDFITTKTHIICLISRIFRDELTQYILQMEYENLLEVTFKYPELKEMVYGEEYSFKPELSSGLVLRYYLGEEEKERGKEPIDQKERNVKQIANQKENVDENADEKNEDQTSKVEDYPLGETGLSINSSTGVITGTSKLIGKFETTIYLDVFLGKTSVTISFVSRCPLGYQQDTDGKRCEKCPVGFYRHKMTLDRCESCNDYIPNTTTEMEGSDTPLNCSCKLGYYNSNSICIECPPGTYSDKIGSFACGGKCPENMMSKVTGAKSLEELKCSCLPGYYFESDKCYKCTVGSYCPGNNEQIKCPENKSTLSEGSTSEEDCLCNAGYELLDQNCKPCNKESYKPNIGNERCSPCSLEELDEFQSYTNKLGATSKDDCRYCKPGHYLYGGVCTQCPPGFFCKGSDSSPIKCGENTIVLKESGTESNDCLCPKGYGFANNGPNADRPKDCIKCPINTFQPIEGSVNGCMACPPNTFTVKDGSTSLLDCIPKSGYYNITYNNYSLLVEEIEVKTQSYNKEILDSMGVKCIRTNEAPFSSNIIQTQDLASCIRHCKLNPYCKYFYYSESNGSTRSNSDFDSDSDPDLDLDSESESELELESDTETDIQSDSDSQNVKLVKTCRVYTTFETKIFKRAEAIFIANPKAYQGPVLCEVLRTYVYPIFIPCPRNYYCPGGISSLKLKCPANSVTLHQGSSSLEDCLCLPGYYLSDESCVPCKIGYYKPTISNSRCTECPENTTTVSEGSFIIKQCSCNKRMYAVSLKKTDDSQSRQLVYINEESEEPEEENTINDLLTKNIKMLTDSSMDFYCADCLHGYFCKGSWIFNLVHMPPIPCFSGSSVPYSRNTQSINSCLCNPGYGLMNYDPNYDPGYGLACEKCLPGRYKSVFENSPCHEACPVHSTSLPGSTSGKQCFCTPGFYMKFEDGKLICKKCTEGALCHGGIENGTHTRPIPKKGFSIVNIPNNSNVDGGSFLQTVDDYDDSIYEYDPTEYIYPCLNPDRCIGGGSCSEGSSGFLCSECDEGYDVNYFNSTCSKCSKDLLKFLISRILVHTFLILISHYNSYYNRASELSLVPIFKILYMFTISLVPLGILPINSGSSLRKFHLLYKRFFFWPLNFYSSVDRVNCFRNFVLKTIEILKDIGIGTTLFNKQGLSYLDIWYIQRYIGIFKVVIDIFIIIILSVTMNLLGKLMFFKDWRLKRRLDFLSENFDITEFSLSSIHMEYDIKPKDKKFRNTLIQQIVLMICLHIPSISLNSLAMVWCTKFSSHEALVLLHQPMQVCSLNDDAFFIGALTSLISMIIVLGWIILMFFRFMNSKYSTDWTNIFITGYKQKYRNWDSIQIIRQLLIIGLIVCQKSMEASDSELNRLLLYMILHIFYLVLILSLQPYDSRSGCFLINLEKTLICGNLFTALFIYGSHFYNYERYAGFPFILASVSYLHIIFTFITETISINNITTTSKSSFSSAVTKLFLLTFKYNNSYLYFNSREDTLVFESYGVSPKSKMRWLLRPLILKHSKKFLTTCFQDLSQQCVSFMDKGMFSREFYYFYVRLIFWHSRCLKINIFDKEIGNLDFIHYLVYLYYFDSKLKNKSSSIIYEYPINNLKTHILHHHGSKSCNEGCSTLVSKSLDESIPEVMACLLVDCLFDRIYESSISLVQFYYSLLTIGHLDKDDVKTIFTFYKTHLSYVRNREKYSHKFKIDSLNSQIQNLKRTTIKETKDGQLRIKQLELLEDKEKLKAEIDKLSELVIEKRKSVDEAKKQFSRASALKTGVENVLSGGLTNDDIVKSISRMTEQVNPFRKSRISLRLKHKRDTVYKLKVL